MEKISLICHIYKTEIPETDWEQTSSSVKGRMEEMKQWIQELEEKLNRTSKNSSSPPSADPLNTEKKPIKKKSGKKRGGQPGHKGFTKFLYPEKAKFTTFIIQFFIKRAISLLPEVYLRRS